MSRWSSREDTGDGLKDLPELSIAILIFVGLRHGNGRTPLKKMAGPLENSMGFLASSLLVGSGRGRRLLACRWRTATLRGRRRCKLCVEMAVTRPVSLWLEELGERESVRETNHPVLCHPLLELNDGSGWSLARRR